MITIERFFWGHMLVAVAALSIGFAAIGYGICSFMLVMLGVAWFTSQQRKSPGVEGLLLFGFVAAAGFGAYMGIPAWLTLIGVVFVLGAWDLYSFLLRLSKAERVEYNSGLGREHLRRLLLIEMISFITGLAALTFRVRISFWWEVLLILIVVIGVSRMIAGIRKETEKENGVRTGDQ